MFLNQARGLFIVVFMFFSLFQKTCQCKLTHAYVHKCGHKHTHTLTCTWQMNSTSTYINYTMSVHTHTHATHTHTLSRAHCTTRWGRAPKLRHVSPLCSLSPFPNPQNKKAKKKKQRTLPTKKSLFMRYYHSYRTKPWMWPSLMRTVKGQKNVETRVHNSYLNGLKKKKSLPQYLCFFSQSKTSPLYALPPPKHS